MDLRSGCAVHIFVRRCAGGNREVRVDDWHGEIRRFGGARSRRGERVACQALRSRCQHDAFLTGLANHYGASFDLKFEGGARNSPDWQYSYSYSNGKRLYVTGNWGIALSTSHSRYAPFLDAGHGEVLEESREFLSFATPGQAMAQGTALLQAMGLEGEYSLRYFYSVNGERYRAAVEETRAAYAEMGKKFDAPELTDFGDDTEIAYVIAFEQSAQGLPIAASLSANGIWSRPTSDMTVTPRAWTA